MGLVSVGSRLTLFIFDFHPAHLTHNPPPVAHGVILQFVYPAKLRKPSTFTTLHGKRDNKFTPIFAFMGDSARVSAVANSGVLLAHAIVPNR